MKKMLKNVVIIESNPHLEALFGLNLKIYVDCSVETKQMAEFAIKQFEESKNLPELIICRDHINAEQTALEIIKYLDARKLDISLLIIGENPPQIPGKEFRSIRSSLDLKNIIRSA